MGEKAMGKRKPKSERGWNKVGAGRSLTEMIRQSDFEMDAQKQAEAYAEHERKERERKEYESKGVEVVR
jgi:hypothetical protein